MMISKLGIVFYLHKPSMRCTQPTAPTESSELSCADAAWTGSSSCLLDFNLLNSTLWRISFYLFIHRMAHVRFLDLRTQKKASWVSGNFSFLKKKLQKPEGSHALHCNYSRVKKQLLRHSTWLTFYEHIICINSYDASTWIKGISGLPYLLWWGLKKLFWLWMFFCKIPIFRTWRHQFQHQEPKMGEHRHLFHALMDHPFRRNHVSLMIHSSCII